MQINTRSPAGANQPDAYAFIYRGVRPDLLSFLSPHPFHFFFFFFFINNNNSMDLNNRV